jgi:dephospho-CoA kinase
MPETRRGRAPALVVAVTGGIGAGKTRFCQALERLPGVRVLEADRIAHRALEENEAVRRAVRARFGAAVFDAHERIDRARLAEIVFADTGARRALEAIVHPVVRAALAAAVAALRSAGDAVIVLVEVPLLAESGVPDWCDRVVAVEASAETRLARARLRGGDGGRIARRMAAQTGDVERRAIADTVVGNEGGEADLERAARALYDAWRAEREDGEA